MAGYDVDIVSVHASRIAEDLYCFGDTCTYDQRDDPLCTVTAVYSFEGSMVELRAFRGKITPSVWRAVKKYLAERGVARVEWRRDNTGVERAKAYSITERRFVEPLFDLI